METTESCAPTTGPHMAHMHASLFPCWCAPSRNSKPSDSKQRVDTLRSDKHYFQKGNFIDLITISRWYNHTKCKHNLCKVRITYPNTSTKTSIPVKCYKCTWLISISLNERDNISNIKWEYLSGAMATLKEGSPSSLAFLNRARKRSITMIKGGGKTVPGPRRPHCTVATSVERCWRKLACNRRAPGRSPVCLGLVSAPDGIALPEPMSI